MDLEFLNIELLNNSVKDYLYVVLTIIIGLIVVRPIISYLLKISYKLFDRKDLKDDKD